MRLLGEPLKKRITMLAALVLVSVLYGFARLPEVSSGEKNRLASGFRFNLTPLTQPAGPPFKYIREVHPSLKRISAWISATGAAVALADLDGDGLPNDICRTETRTDQLVVQPAPGTGNRYSPFVLTPAPLVYDTRTMAPTGCLAGDFNEDGLMDILAYYWGRTPVAFLRAKGTPGQKSALAAADYVPMEVAPVIERWYTNTEPWRIWTETAILILFWGTSIRMAPDCSMPRQRVLRQCTAPRAGPITAAASI